MSLQGSTIGFIGLGLMGKPMVRNLRAAGADLVIHNRSRAAVDELVAPGISPAQSPREVTERSDQVVIMVTDTAAVDAVLSGPDGVVAGLAPGALVIDMGTTAVVATRRFAASVEAAGADYVDAPVSGGEMGAQSGTLTVMAGAAPKVFDRALPMLEVLGEHVTHVGDIGAGQVAKSANQMIVGITIGAVAEALTLARRAGVDPQKVRDALSGGFASSRILEVHGQRMIDADFTPGGRATTQRKDLAEAIEFAASLGLRLPVTETNLATYDRLIEQGDGALDQSALIRAIDTALAGD